MRDLLQQALEALDVLLAQRSGDSWMQDCADRIRAELARSEWVPVDKRLPVVPEGKFSVRIWGFRADKGKVFRANWWQHHGFQKINFTHWMYRQDEPPAPPKETP